MSTMTAYSPRRIHIPNDLTTLEYHELLSYYRFKADINPANTKYKWACDDICKILNGESIIYN